MAVSIDQQFIEYIVKSLVGHPDDVKIERRIDEKGVLLELWVNPEDLGRVIGKRGATAQSLRTLLRALGTKNDARYNLKIIDTGPPREDREPSPAEAPAFAEASSFAKAPASAEAPAGTSAGRIEGKQKTDDKVPADDQTSRADDSATTDDSTPADDLPAGRQDQASSAADDVDMSEDEELPEAPKEDHSDVVSRTRKELADLDDLDV
ncbi:KH domain-containing protein [Candidatus Saccharibacteria bacterium]|nr:KH domain-containing protein [Candidatus Saccharibacteria bacterium]